MRFLRLKNKQALPWLVPWTAAATIALLRRTWRVRLHDPAQLLQSRQPWPVIFLLWHNRILSLPDCFPRAMREAAAVLISASRDGNYATAFIRYFGFNVVRGSSSRGGAGALRELRRTLAEGRAVVITLDGPRGPKYEAHPGAAALAELCGVPIVPISLNAPRRWEFKSWDRTQVPKPFARVHLEVGLPVTAPANSTRDSRKQASAWLREALLAITVDG